MGLIHPCGIDGIVAAPIVETEGIIKDNIITDSYAYNRILDLDLIEDIQKHIILLRNGQPEYVFNRRLSDSYSNHNDRKNMVKSFKNIKEAYSELCNQNYKRVIKIINDITRLIIKDAPNARYSFNAACVERGCGFVLSNNYSWVLCPSLEVKDKMIELIGKYEDVIDFNIDKQHVFR